MQRTLRTALVTGGASGIGAAVVERLRADGVRVAALDASAEALGASPAEVGVRADVRSPAEVAGAVAQAVRELGGLDGLVCCAGVVRPGTVDELDLDDWRLQFDVNVLGTMLSVRSALAHLRADGGGAVVTIASNLALVAEPGVPAYCASKGAVLALTRALALDHAAEGVRFNCVSPGPTWTPMVRGFVEGSEDPAAAEAEVAAGQAHGRLIEPAEIADAIAYLLSPRAGSTIGANLVVDGGYTIR
jgi:2-keto-3-deoxy-L-fuconate dehydrogenase